MPDLDAAAELTQRALAIARGCDDVDLELVALAQLGLISVAAGDSTAGFAMIDEAVAAALGGERSSLDTIVHTCCDMLNACEVATDLERASQWCQVADSFIEQYGCPFLYAECRTLYGSVLAAGGRWADADRELAAALQITAGTCPALHDKALTRLAALRIRQGRLEEAPTDGSWSWRPAMPVGRRSRCSARTGRVAMSKSCEPSSSRRDSTSPGTLDTPLVGHLVAARRPA